MPVLESFKSLQGQAHGSDAFIVAMEDRRGRAPQRRERREHPLLRARRPAGAQIRSRENDYRLYNGDDVHRLRFIRLCRAMDMSLDEVRALLALDLGSKADCARACEVLDEHLRHVRQRLAELKALEKDLRHLRDRCDGSDDHCHIIEALHRQADAAEAVPVAAGPRRHV